VLGFELSASCFLKRYSTTWTMPHSLLPKISFKTGGRMAQVLEHLLSKCEAQSWSPSTAKKKKKQERRRTEERENVNKRQDTISEVKILVFK
jgi:hypothetical protein